MKNIAHTPKKLFKSFLQQLGLYAYVLRIKRRKYQSIKMFAVTINGVKVQFSTENEYSNSWFFPRYTGGKIHEKRVTEMLIKVLDSAKCFVDIGANLGWYTCLACKHMPQGIVYGFEMDDLNFAFLQKNIAINSCTNVEVHNLAISDSSGVLSYKRESNRPSPLFRLTSGDTDKNSAGLVSVSSITLDDFFKSKELMPDVIKIDVEGAEMNVLRGMRRITREFKPTLFLEVHPDNLPSFNTSSSAILSLLIDNGYKVFEIEEMRGHKSSERLKALSQGSVLERNTMLYAVAAK